MTVSTYGDLAATRIMQDRAAQTKRALSKYSLETTTGKTSNVRNHLGGDLDRLAEVQRGLDLLSTYSDTANVAAMRGTNAQAVLGSIHAEVGDLVGSILSSSTSETELNSKILSQRANGAFGQVVSALNARSGGVSLFSGARTHSAALADAGSILASLKSALTGSASPADFIATVNDWFMNAGGGFDTVAYQGSQDSAPPAILDDDVTLDFETRADAVQFRKVLAGVAIAALAADSDFGFSAADQTELVRESGEMLLTAQDGVVVLQAEIGVYEERVAQIQTRQVSERTALELAKADLIGVDSYEAAIHLQSAQVQMETVYTLTARLSRLSLAEYL